MKRGVINRTWPPDRASWESAVNLIENLSGQRGTKLAVPALETMTFSNPPTQAECTALYNYVNRVRAGVAAIAARLDG